MTEEISVDETTGVRPRKACINCYERKIKCDFDSGSSSCRSCKKNSVPCVIADSDVPRPRKSIRATVEELENRVQLLEEQGNPGMPASTMPSSHFASVIPSSSKLPVEPIEATARVESSSDGSLTTLSSGKTSPWAILLSGTENSNPELRNFRTTALRSANIENSIMRLKDTIPYNIMSEVPGLSPVKVESYVQNYTRVAPYPILNRNGMQLIIRNLIERKQVKCVGQATCVWIYMAFGAAHGGDTTADISNDKESGLYFRMAWDTLPQLLLDYDSWAFKAITLIVHYLQATAKPQSCWALLGTALRLAISLGFDQDDNYHDVYSQTEREECRRAFWLCYIMEKSLCMSLGQASSLPLIPRALKPLPFVPEAIDDEEILDTDDHAAANFFCQMIELTEVRDKILDTLRAGDIGQDDSYRLLLSDLEQIINTTGSAQEASAENIRDCIRDLAYFNTLQVLQITQSQAYGGQIPQQAIVSARQSLDLISGSQRSGQLMCIWMWLYYAFTSAVTLFLHSIANPLDPETALNMAAIADLEDIYQGVLDVSDGAVRCMEIAKAMRATINRIIKVAGRKRAREDEDADDGGAKIRRIEPDDPGHLTDSEQEQIAGQDPNTASVDALLEGLPSNLVWDQWDDWLKDANPIGEDEF